jgi:hypothetical protein
MKSTLMMTLKIYVFFIKQLYLINHRNNSIRYELKISRQVLTSMKEFISIIPPIRINNYESTTYSVFLFILKFKDYIKHVTIDYLSFI